MIAPNGPLEARDPVPGPVTVMPDPEVPERLERARRRQFTVGYKLRILTEADTARTTGEIGALPDRPTEIWHMRSDSSKARDELGYRPRRSLVEGLEQTIAWYRRDVLPHYRLHTEPTRQFADLILPWTEAREEVIDLLAAGIRARLEG